jgi:L-ascorbate metabolism protein UlaG (beta-lactamase superfamily)
MKMLSPLQTSGIRLRWLGHATVLLELGGARLVTDPVLRARLGHLTRRTPPIAPAELGALDAALVSHVHRDHLDIPTLARLEGEPQVLVPAGVGDLVRGHGPARVVELSEGESHAIEAVRVTATAAHHRARRGPRSPWLPSLGFLIEAGGSRIYFAGDTDIYPEMAALVPLDVALLPVWGWGPSIGEGHLNPRTAAEGLRLLRPRVAVPIHWGTYFPWGLRGARLKDPPHEFARHAGELAREVDVRVLAPGDELVL